MAAFAAEIVERPQFDLAAFRQWMKPYEARVYALAVNLAGNAADAEAVLLETFVKAGRQFIRRSVAQRNFAWLAALAVREWLGLVRVSRFDLAGWLSDQTTTLEDRERQISAWAENPSMLQAVESRRRILLAALATLTPMDRAAFVLREMTGFSDDEVSAVLGMERLDLRLRLNRARVSLRDKLDPVCRSGAKFEPRPRAQASRSMSVAPHRGLRREVYV